MEQKQNHNLLTKNHTMTPTKENKNPFMYYSGFKLSICFKNNRGKFFPLHSVDTKNTLPQVYYRKIPLVKLDREAGFNWCIETVERMADKIHHCSLYDAYNNDVLYRQFKSDEWIIYQEPQFDDSNRIVISYQFTVKNGFVVLQDIEANSLAVKY